jgi:hypothetical protein
VYHNSIAGTHDRNNKTSEATLALKFNFIATFGPMKLKVATMSLRQIASAALIRLSLIPNTKVRAIYVSQGNIRIKKL